MSEREEGQSWKGIPISLLEKMEFAPNRVVAPIDCDDVSFEPPQGLMVAGFPWRARRDSGSDLGWEVDENLVDTLVAWSSIGNAAKSAAERVECVLEVDWREEIPAEDLIHLAASGEFSVALVGLELSDAENAAAYCARLKDLASRMLKTGNYSKMLFPFSPIFETVFLEKMGKAADAKAIREKWARREVDIENPMAAKTEYALRRTPLGRRDVQAACEEALLEHFGDEKLLEAAMKALARPIAKRLESFAEEIKTQPKAKDERFGLAPA